MREYQTVYITHPLEPETQLAERQEKFAAIIAKHGGRVFYSRSMGKRTLAYPIAKQTKGIYTCLDYADRGASVAEIERAMRIDESVLRFLTVLKAEEVDVEARAAEVVARGEDRAPEVGEQRTDDVVQPVRDIPEEAKGVNDVYAE